MGTSGVLLGPSGQRIDPSALLLGPSESYWS